VGFRFAGGFALVLAAAIACNGCAGLSPTVDRWLGRTAAPAGSGAAFYSAVDGLTVYAGPARSSAVVGKLPLHERVSRSKLEGGYAYIQADQIGLRGWVDNAQLLWRLPAGAAAPPVAGEPAEAAGRKAGAPTESDATAVGTATESEGQPAAAPEPAAKEPEPAQAPPSKPETPPEKASKPAPSVFDPF
jgi:hypothetical protein